MKWLLGVFWVSCVFAQDRLITHVTDPQGQFETRLILVNHAALPTSYRLDAIGLEGQTVAVARGALAAQVTRIVGLDELFGLSSIAYLRVSSDEGFSVLARYRRKSGGAPVEVAESRELSRRWQFYTSNGDTVTDGMALVNPGSQPADLALRVFDASGEMVSSSDLGVLAEGFKGLQLFDIAPPGAYAVLESTQPLSVMALRFQQSDPAVFWPIPAVPLADAPQAPTAPVSLTLLYTNDEHGWMEAQGDIGGAAEMLGLWREVEGLRPDGNFLVLSGGDMWTGPAIATWTKGESMANVLNLMGYQAAAVGNHEFDFGVDILNERREASSFPFLAANIERREGPLPPLFAEPYIIRRVGGLDVGILGLTTVGTPQITFPEVTGPYVFRDYEQVLRQYIPEMDAHGADLVLVVGHVCWDELRHLIPVARQLGVDFLGGGHCHGTGLEIVEGIPVLEADSYLRHYGRVDLTVDPGSGEVLDVKAEIKVNRGGRPDPLIETEVDRWREATDEILSMVIGYASQEIPQRSAEMENMIVDSWLWSSPHMQIAMTNRGGIRQSIPAGNITVGTILGLLPFENFIVELELTGAQVIENIVCCHPVLGGMTADKGYRLSDGTTLDPQASYRVMTTDFMYEGGSGFLFRNQDPEPFHTGISWRQPVIDWIESNHTSADNPLNLHLDGTPRDQTIPEGFDLYQ